MTTATFNGVVIAESDATIEVEGNHYFPRDSVRTDALISSDHTTMCGWKGEASYYTVSVEGKSVDNGAWYYPTPYDQAEHITDFIAFYRTQIEIN